MTYPDTYYSRTIADTTDRPSMSGRLECDTLVVGGGLAGLTVALQLARAGRAVVVLEAQNIGFGASGRNGGFVGPGFSTSRDQITRMAGKEAAHQIHQLSIEGMDFVRQTINDLSIESARAQSGVMHVVRHEDADSLKAHVEEVACKFNYQLEFLDRDRVRSVLKTKRYFEGVRDANAFHIHPLNYLRGIAAEIERLRGRVFEHSPAIAVELDGATKIVRTASGETRSRHIVVATGGYTGSLIGRIKRAFLPIATYVMLSEEAPELIAEVIATTDAVGDNRRAGDYYRRVDDGRRLLWGGRITTRAASPGPLVKALRHEMIATYPELAGLKTELAWSGLMSYARHLMPQIGQLQSRVWYCTAFGGHGLNTTAIGGKLVAEAILGESDRYRLFKPFGLDWAGGAAGLAVAQLAYWKLQAQDWWQERNA